MDLENELQKLDVAQFFFSKLFTDPSITKSFNQPAIPFSYFTRYGAWTRFQSKFSCLRKIQNKKLKILKIRVGPNLYGKPKNFLGLEKEFLYRDKYRKIVFLNFLVQKPHSHSLKIFWNCNWHKVSSSKLNTGRPRIWYQVLPVFFLFFFQWQYRVPNAAKKNLENFLASKKGIQYRVKYLKKHFFEFFS